MNQPRISVTDPLGRAVEWTTQVLFRPFSAEKWFGLGFCAWLAALAEGGGSGANWNVPGGRDVTDFDSARSWVGDHLAVVSTVVIVGGALVLGLVVLLAWISSRGKFMFVDGVVENRGAVAEPWSRFRELGNSLFVFRIALTLAGIVVFGVLVLLAVTNLWALAPAEASGVDAWSTSLVLLAGFWGAVFLLTVLSFALVAVATNDFIVPIMWRRQCLVMDAWSVFRAELPGRGVILALYVGMKILLGIAVALIACAVTCLTCCIAAIPYLGTVLLLPLHVFLRSFSLYFFSQFGEDWAALAPGLPPEAAPPAVIDPPAGDPA